MKDQKKPHAKRGDIVTQELAGELLIYNVATDRAFCLNETSAFVWKHADGQKTAGEIKGLMEREYKLAVNEDLIWLALDQLGREQLLESDAEAEREEKNGGVTRREVVRRIAMSSLIALPVIASLATPVHAQGCPFSGAVSERQCSSNSSCAGRACTSGGTCTSGGACVSAISLE
jgi:hypothetical protein